MAIRVQCPNPSCGQVITVRDEFAGKRGRCPSCGSALMIPSPAVRDPVAPRPPPGYPPAARDRPRTDDVVDVTAVTDQGSATPGEDSRVTPTDVTPLLPGRPIEPASMPASGPLAGSSMAELSARTALIIGIAALVLLSFLPQVRWLYVSDPSRGEGREWIQAVQLGVARGMTATGISPALLVYSALLAFLAVLGLLALEVLPREHSDAVIAAVGSLAGSWGVIVFFLMLGYIWKAFSTASEYRGKQFTILPGFGLGLGLIAALAVMAVFGYLTASRRRFLGLAGAGALGFFFGMLLLILSVRPWEPWLLGPP